MQVELRDLTVYEVEEGKHYGLQKQLTALEEKIVALIDVKRTLTAELVDLVGDDAGFTRCVPKCRRRLSFEAPRSTPLIENCELGVSDMWLMVS